MDIDSVKSKLLDAEVRCNQWLADGNQAAESGKTNRAEECYSKSQFWLDRANGLRDKLWALKR